MSDKLKRLPYPWLPAWDEDNQPGGAAYVPTPEQIEIECRKIRLRWIDNPQGRKIRKVSSSAPKVPTRKRGVA